MRGQLEEINRRDTETRLDDLSHQAASLCLYDSTVLCESSSLCLREHLLFEPATHAREVRLFVGKGGMELGRHLGMLKTPAARPWSFEDLPTLHFTFTTLLAVPPRSLVTVMFCGDAAKGKVPA